MLYQTLSLLLIVLGEIAMIWAELAGAHIATKRDAALSHLLLPHFTLCIVGAGFLFAGYVTAMVVFKDIWLVSAISVSTILMVEPGVAYLLFQELPTRGAAVGLGLGVAGLVATLVW